MQDFLVGLVILVFGFALGIRFAYRSNKGISAYKNSKGG